MIKADGSGRRVLSLHAVPVLGALQAGNAFSWFGYGLILPFEIIYLHHFRGFSTATARLVLAAILGSGTLVTPPREPCSTAFVLSRSSSPPTLRAHSALPALFVTGRGKRFHSFVLGALAADLAPPHLLGRYISVFSLMVTGGFAIGPAIKRARCPHA